MAAVSPTAFAACTTMVVAQGFLGKRARVLPMGDVQSSERPVCHGETKEIPGRMPGTSWKVVRTQSVPDVAERLPEARE